MLALCAAGFGVSCGDDSSGPGPASTATAGGGGSEATGTFDGGGGAAASGGAGGNAAGTATPAMRFVPGIYKGAGSGSATKPPLQVSDIVGNPNFVGATRMYRWVDLEPEEGVYDFSFIIQDHDVAASHGLHFGVRVSFSSYFGTPKIPDYILQDAAYGGSTPGLHGTCFAANNPDYVFALYWHPLVKARFLALVSELATALEPLPNLSLVAIGGESSTGARTHCEGWSCSAERDAYMEIAAHQKSLFPSTPVFTAANFGCYDIADELVPYLVSNCIGIMPPNIKPDNGLLDANAYSGMREHHEAVWMGVNWDAYNDHDTPEEMLAFVKSGIQPHYLQVTLTNENNRAELLAAIDTWMAAQGGWPWTEAPSCVQ